MTVFDLHVHTSRGSSDSNLTPEQLAERAIEIGLDGVCLTEHGGGWDRREIERTFPSELTVIGGIEAATDAGHVLVYGMQSYVNGMHSAAGVRKAVDRAGGVMVSAHPFRNLFNPRPNIANLLYPDPCARPESPRRASEHSVFGAVDEMETANGGNTPEENEFAAAVARELGLRGTGGSDAHSLHGLGRCVTVFDGDVRSEADLIEALRNRAFAPAERPALKVSAPLSTHSQDVCADDD